MLTAKQLAKAQRELGRLAAERLVTVRRDLLSSVSGRAIMCAAKLYSERN